MLLRVPVVVLVCFAFGQGDGRRVFAERFDFVVHGGRNYADHGHHAHHGAGPAFAEAVVFGFVVVDFVIDDPHILGVAGDLAMDRVVHVGADHGDHLVHHVMGEVAMEHPVAEVLGDKLDVAGLGDADDDGIFGVPGGLRAAAGFGAGVEELIAVEVHGMVVHAHIDEADADAFPLFDDHGRCVRAGFSVEGEPVEFHGERVGNRIIGLEVPLLENDPVVAVDDRSVSLRGVGNEHADEAHHFLHREMRVVEKRTVLAEGELVDVAAAGLDGVHAEADGAIDFHGKFEAMPVDARHFWELIFDDDAEAITFVDLDHGAGDGAVEAPRVHDAAGGNGGADDLGDEGELLHSVDELVGELGEVGSLNANRKSGRGDGGGRGGSRRSE